MGPAPDFNTRGGFDEVAFTSGMTPRGSLHRDAPDGVIVTVAYAGGVRPVKRRGELLIDPGVIGFSPFEPIDGAGDISCAVAGITMTRGRAPWSSIRLELDGPVRVRIFVPRRSQRRVRELLSAAGVHLHDQT
jgi:hypothetical protein